MHRDTPRSAQGTGHVAQHDPHTTHVVCVGRHAALVRVGPKRVVRPRRRRLRLWQLLQRDDDEHAALAIFRQLNARCAWQVPGGGRQERMRRVGICVCGWGELSKLRVTTSTTHSLLMRNGCTRAAHGGVGSRVGLERHELGGHREGMVGVWTKGSNGRIKPVTHTRPPPRLIVCACPAKRIGQGCRQLGCHKAKTGFKRSNLHPPTSARATSARLFVRSPFLMALAPVSIACDEWLLAAGPDRVAKQKPCQLRCISRRRCKHARLPCKLPCCLQMYGGLLTPARTGPRSGRIPAALSPIN
eukprot:352001-Chlamydomonas_euryale.AAC.5